MLISPKTAIESGWITHPECKIYQDWVDRKFVSPNAIDFTLDTVFSIDKSKSFFISEKGKEMRGGMKQVAVEHPNGQSYFKIPKEGVVDGMSEMYVEIPEGVSCSFIIRSTLNRNGLYMTNGLYDSGFKGNLGFAIHNRSGQAHIAPGTRVGQIIFQKSESEGTYEGGYNTEKGAHWTEEKPKTKKKATKKQAKQTPVARMFDPENEIEKKQSNLYGDELLDALSSELPGDKDEAKRVIKTLMED